MNPVPNYKHTKTFGSAMAKAGFELDNTGGGIKVWRRQLSGDGGPEMSLTDVEDTSYPPPALAWPALVSLWDEHSQSLTQWTVPCLGDFLRSLSTTEDAAVPGGEWVEGFPTEPGHYWFYCFDPRHAAGARVMLGESRYSANKALLHFRVDILWPREWKLPRRIFHRPAAVPSPPTGMPDGRQCVKESR